MLLEVAHLEGGTWGPKLEPGACPSDESGVVDDNGKGSLGPKFRELCCRFAEEEELLRRRSTCLSRTWREIATRSWRRWALFQVRFGWVARTSRGQVFVVLRWEMMESRARSTSVDAAATSDGQKEAIQR